MLLTFLCFFCPRCIDIATDLLKKRRELTPPIITTHALTELLQRYKVK